MNASLFVSTFYTRVGGDDADFAQKEEQEQEKQRRVGDGGDRDGARSSVRQLLLIHDMLPELFGWDLSDHQYVVKQSVCCFLVCLLTGASSWELFR